MTSLIRPSDESANLMTHAFGLILSTVAVSHLIAAMYGKTLAIISACGVYGLCLILVYASSTLSHLFYDLKWRQRFRTWDQASIFLMIAGTFTPIAVLYLRGGWQWCHALMWILAAIGALRVVQLRELPRREKLSYGILGLIPGIALHEISYRASQEVVFWMILGGASYLLGIPFLIRSAAVPYSHAVWHIFVMIGSACHYRAILLAIEASPGSC